MYPQSTNKIDQKIFKRQCARIYQIIKSSERVHHMSIKLTIKNDILYNLKGKK